MAVAAAGTDSLDICGLRIFIRLRPAAIGHCLPPALFSALPCQHLRQLRRGLTVLRIFPDLFGKPDRKCVKGLVVPPLFMELIKPLAGQGARRGLVRLVDCLAEPFVKFLPGGTLFRYLLFYFQFHRMILLLRFTMILKVNILKMYTSNTGKILGHTGLNVNRIVCSAYI